MGPQLPEGSQGRREVNPWFRLRVYNESGTKLGDFDLGSNADEGHYDERTHTYYSSNGYSY